MQKSMSLKYEPASEPLHISAKKLFLPRNLKQTFAINTADGVKGDVTIELFADAVCKPPPYTRL